MNRDVALGATALACIGAGAGGWLLGLNWAPVLAAATLGAAIVIAKGRERRELHADIEREGVDSYLMSAAEDGAFVGISKKRQMVLIGDADKWSWIDPKDVIAVEVRANNASVSKVNRGSQLAGAAIGAAALGGIGLLVGALTAKTTTRDAVNSLTLHVVTTTRHVSIALLPDGAKLAPDSRAVLDALAKARQWQHRLTEA